MSDGRLRYDEAVEAIAPKLADLAVVLVGGQALNYWVDRYRDRAPELQAFCAREFMRELVARGKIRDALNLAKRIEAFALRGAGLLAFTEVAVDIFAAVEPHAELGEKFVSLHYPQMTTRLAMKREKARRRATRPEREGPPA